MTHDETPMTPEQRKKRRWERRRKWNELRWSALSMLVLAVVFFGTALFLLLFPRSTESQLEKRTLAKFPDFSLKSYFSGDFTGDITTYYDDTVPFRDSFKNAGNQMRSMLGLRNAKDTITIINSDVVAENMNAQAQKPSTASTDSTTPAESTQPTDATEETPSVTEEPTQHDYTGEEAEVSMSNGLMIVNQDNHWKCLPLFGGGSGKNYIEALNTLQEKVGDDVTIYSMPAPLSSEFYVPSNAAGSSASQSDCFDAIAEQLDSRIVSINLCPVMAKHTEEPIYCRTDHHWQPLGAYYACRTFAEAAGVPFAELDQYEKGVNEGYVGTMYAFTDDSRLLNDPEDFIYYTPTCDYTAYYYNSAFHYQYEDDLFAKVDTANSYLMFMGSDTYIVKVNTSVKNGRKLLVVKDSYGNAEIPFYTSSFEQVYVVDMRYFERNLVNFIDAMDITDVLFTMCSYSVVGVNADGMMDLITQDAGSTIVDEQLEQP